MSKPEVYYRVRDYRTAGAADEYGDPVPGSGSVAFTLETYRVVGRTPKGVRLKRVLGDFLCGDTPRLMLFSSVKRFAAPSIEEAVSDWRARKAKEKRIYTARLRHVEEALAKIGGEMRQWKQKERIEG
jgi:hypothetical protein